MANTIVTNVSTQKKIDLHSPEIIMIIKVETISEPTMIKPSSPTPDHLKLYELSFLDQISPPVYNPMVFFYHSDHSINTQKVNDLKTSLSRVLTHYYPLAGRVDGNTGVRCTDDGVPFYEARVACRLHGVLQDPVPGELNKLVPFELDAVDDVALGVQFNVFACGGVGVGLCVSHKLCDALSFFTFVRAWAAMALGEKEVVKPLFVAAELFPPRNIAGFKPSTGIVKDKNIVTKRFVFTSSVIADIREKYAKGTNQANQRPPSRVEALSSFIYSRLLAATDFKSSTTAKLHLVNHAVNLRPRIDPPIPEHSFGNLYRVATTVPSLDTDDDCDGQALVSQVRDSIKKIDGQYVKMLQKGNEHLENIRERAGMFVRGEMVSFSFTSLCRFPLYEADFGWGRPVWVGSPSLTFKNLVFFIDTNVGDGIEGYVSLEKEVMDKFEGDEVFQAHVSPLTSVG